MLEEIGTPDRAEAWLMKKLGTKDKIMGFGHRVYKKGDSRVPVMRMLGLKPPKETADEALALAERGYHYVKIKIGLDDKRDIETVKRTRDALGEDVYISVDANQAYTPMQAVKILNQLSDCNLVVVEQPVRQDDVRGQSRALQVARLRPREGPGDDLAVRRLHHRRRGGAPASGTLPRARRRPRPRRAAPGDRRA